MKRSIGKSAATATNATAGDEQIHLIPLDAASSSSASSLSRRLLFQVRCAVAAPRSFGLRRDHPRSRKIRVRRSQTPPRRIGAVNITSLHSPLPRRVSAVDLELRTEASDSKQPGSHAVDGSLMGCGRFHASKLVSSPLAKKVEDTRRMQQEAMRSPQIFATDPRHFVSPPDARGSTSTSPDKKELSQSQHNTPRTEHERIPTTSRRGTLRTIRRTGHIRTGRPLPLLRLSREGYAFARLASLSFAPSCDPPPRTSAIADSSQNRS